MAPEPQPPRYTYRKWPPDGKPPRISVSLGWCVYVDAPSTLLYPAGMTDFYHPFAPSASELRGRRPDVSEILPNLFVGEYPRVEDALWLKQTFGISAVLSLQDADDISLKGLDITALKSTYQAHRIEFARTPIADYDCHTLATALPQALDQLHTSIQSGRRVFLHCNAGCNRAPTVAIAYLHIHHAMSLEGARDFFKARRPCGPYMNVLYEYFGQNG